MGIVADIASIQSQFKEVYEKQLFCFSVKSQDRTTSSVAPQDLSPIECTSSTSIKLKEPINFLFSFHFQVKLSHFSGVATMIADWSSSHQFVKSESPVHSATFIPWGI